MKSEIHIINLIQTSSYIRRLISAMLAISPKPWETEDFNDLLLRLPLKETLKSLMENLECDDDEVFQKIAARGRALVTDHFPFNFTLEHLRELDNMNVLDDTNVQSPLSSIFNCSPWDVLDEVLDVQAILDTLFEVAPEMVRHMLCSRIQDDSPFSQVSEAVENILSIHRKVEEHFGIDEYKWDRIVDEHNWLKGSAIDKLRSFCDKRGIIQQSGASLLAAVLQEYAPDESEDEIQLDTLAVIHIQQRINWIVRQLHEQAEGLAQKVSTSAEASSPWAQLEQYLKFYELKAPASAWRRVIEPTKIYTTTIIDKLSQIDVRSIQSSGTPKKSTYLKVRTEEIEADPSLPHQREKGEILLNLIVSCQIEESDMPCDILICNNVPSTQLDLLEQFFSSIPAITAATCWVSDIGGQLMIAPVISSDSFREALLIACANCSREIIQALILAGVKLVSELEPELDKRLNYELSIKPVKYEQDLIHSISRADVLDMCKKDYTDQSNVRIIK